MKQRMQKKSLKLNYLFNVAYQILLLIVPLITTPYISRVLGAEGIGEYSYTYSIVCYFLLIANMGTVTYGQRAIAYYQDDIDKRSVQFFEIFCFRVLSSLMCMVAYGCFCITHFSVINIAQGIYLIATLFDISWLFQGMENFRQIVFKNALVKVISVALIFLLIKRSGDLIKYCLILSVSVLIGNLSLWPYLTQYIHTVSLKAIHPFSHMKDIVLLFLPTVATQVYTVLDKTMLGTLATGMAENGYYEQSEKIVRMALAIVTAFGAVMIPRIAQVYADGNNEQLQQYLGKSFNFAWILSCPIMFGIMGISKLFVPVFYGPGYEKVEILLPLYSCLIIPVALSNVVGCQYLIPTKQQNVYTLAVSISAVCNLCMNAILIPRFYSVGAAAASVIAEYIGIIVMLFYLYKCSHLKVSNIFLTAKKYIIAGLLMFVLVRGCASILPASAVSVGVLVGVGGGTYFLALVLLKDTFLISNFQFVWKKIRK